MDLNELLAAGAAQGCGPSWRPAERRDAPVEAVMVPIDDGNEPEGCYSGCGGQDCDGFCGDPIHDEPSTGLPNHT